MRPLRQGHQSHTAEVTCVTAEVTHSTQSSDGEALVAEPPVTRQRLHVTAEVTHSAHLSHGEALAAEPLVTQSRGYM